MRITSKGQVTIPVEIRRQFDFGPETEVEFVVVGDAVQVRKAGAAPTRGRRVVERLTGAGYRGPSTEELMALTRGEP